MQLESEVHHVPHTIAGRLFLGDWMFFNKSYLASIEAAGGFFLVKAKGNLNPTLGRAYTPGDQTLPQPTTQNPQAQDTEV